MSGSRTAGQQGRTIGSPGLRARIMTKQADEVEELEAKLAEMRKLAAQGVITQEALADWEARGGRELVELREAANTESRNTMGKNLHTPGEHLERYLIEHPDKNRRSGRDLIAAMDADTRELREAMGMGTTRSVGDVAVDLYEAFRRSGHSEREAFHMARGRDLSAAEMRRALDSQKVALSESSSPAAKVDATLEAAFADMGLSESARKTATHGR